MSLEQQLRSDLKSAVDQVPHRSGSVDQVIETGHRRRTLALSGRVAGMALALVAVVGIGVLHNRSAVGELASSGGDSSLSIGGYEIPVDGLVEGLEDQKIYKGVQGPSFTAPLDGYGPEQKPLDRAPTLNADVAPPSIYVGDFSDSVGSVYLFSGESDLGCIWMAGTVCSPADQLGSLQWQITPVENGSATMLLSWYGLPAHASIVTITVDGLPVGWQHVTAGTVMVNATVEAGSDVVLTALDSEGEPITTTDGTDSLRFEQRFDNLTPGDAAP